MDHDNTLDCKLRVSQSPAISWHPGCSSYLGGAGGLQPHASRSYRVAPGCNLASKTHGSTVGLVWSIVCEMLTQLLTRFVSFSFSIIQLNWQLWNHRFLKRMNKSSKPSTGSWNDHHHHHHHRRRRHHHHRRRRHHHHHQQQQQKKQQKQRLSIYIYLYLSLSILYLYLSLSLSVSIYIYLYLSISIYIYLYLSLSISIYLSLSINLYRSIYLSI